MNNKPHDKPTILNCRTLGQNTQPSRLFKIEQVTLEFSNGEQRNYERIITPGGGAVMIIPVIDEQHVMMVREYAVGTDRYELVFPKGKIDPGESILQAASRECMEETGYRASKLTPLGEMTIAPGYLSLITHIVLAENLQAEKKQGDEPEELQQLICNINDIASIISNENLTEARSIAAFYQVRDILLNRRDNSRG